MILFWNEKNEIIKAIGVTHDNTDHLVKVSKRRTLHFDSLNNEME